jgi:hypothetical protein
LSRVKQAVSPPLSPAPAALPATKLIAIGYWRSLHEPQLPDPAWFADADWAATIRQQVVDYLSKGRQLFTWMGFSWCRFRCEHGKHLGARDFTDGTYIWPEGLAHYVAHHHVRLPDEVVTHILAQPAFPRAAAEQIPETKETLETVEINWWTGQRGWDPTASSFWTHDEEEVRAFIRRVERGQLEDYSDDGKRTMEQIAQIMRAELENK